MQISRHWRLNAKRYRFEGVRYPTGELSLIGGNSRPDSSTQQITENEHSNNQLVQSGESQASVTTKENIIDLNPVVTLDIGNRSKEAVGC